MRADKLRSKFVLCVRSEGADDLEPRKVYQVLSDRSASSEGLLRVIDESGEDYLYPAEYFAPVRLPLTVARGWASTSARRAPVTARGTRH